MFNLLLSETLQVSIFVMLLEVLYVPSHSLKSRSHRWTCFFVLIVGGAQWYSWRVRRTSQEELERTNRTVQQLENKNEPRIAQDTTVPTDDETLESLEVPIVSDETQVMSEEMGALQIDDTKLLDPGTDVSLPDDVVSDKEATKDVPVSPFGFGPYPGIPDDFPEPDIFESLASMGNSDMRKALELQKRLIVKFWKQGKSLENVGVTGDADGKVYLLYPDVVYVTWDYWTDENGTTHRYAGVTRGHPDTAHIYEPYLDKGEIPPRITVYELPDGYIDAYEFLGLTR